MCVLVFKYACVRACVRVCMHACLHVCVCKYVPVVDLQICNP